jgi:hypothetical protein
MDRQSNGLFAPGNQLGRNNAGQALYARALRKQIQAKFDPERIAREMEEALALAKSQRSTRGVVAVLELIVAYGAGKPQQSIRLENDDAPPEWVSAILDRHRLATESDDVGVIEGEGRIVVDAQSHETPG